ncbi:sugar phosphate isomerase/epimerase [Paenibacillus chondroitinus]|uniref:Sugar phosphate isomerase/epimerase n=1 Tax=Paenibacillus chondroitinus TaxID=59842 RepID=A0ABU6D8N4_9BACL|nr:MULTISPECIES: sugar phosphate isomerase/epimerase [Paenibacillus]MCY9659706.1 sugar phosphate isomerase/epimerase [Paenibacillus anseongense]MEB4794115.1 sugar phosphate isomerase/epimerase [Paenibacillus chondroitinus]
MRIAAQLYTLRNFLKTPADISESLKKVKQLGYNAVQASGIGPIDIQEFKALADQEGLTICATHIGYNDLLNDMDAVIKKHQAWDCKYVGLGGLPPEFRENSQGYATFAKQASEFGKQLKDAGLQFIYHNHDFEFAKYEGKTGMDILFEMSDPDSVDFELDVYWVQAGGADPVEWIRKMDGRMKVVHFKDMIVTPDRKQRFSEVGEGNMNFKGIIQACEDIGVEWAAVEQDDCYDRNPFESLEISFANLAKLGAKA